MLRSRLPPQATENVLPVGKTVEGDQPLMSANRRLHHGALTPRRLERKSPNVLKHGAHVLHEARAGRFAPHLGAG